ncbi:MAG: nucleotidyl transferase AbiEii/AbiGii toxin family protein [Saprospiraceae bacterium]
MMSLDEIRSFYPPNLHAKSDFLLREYLQYKILEILFNSDYARKFAFLGGTCSRIVHNNQRFSEDLDFDNFDLSANDFVQVSEIIKEELERNGYEVEIRNVMRSAFHCYIRFPNLLFETGLSGHREAKILINLDTEPQGFTFQPDEVFLNKFDVFTTIFTTPIDLLLSQKFLAITHRRRPKGRDFFDVIFLLSRTQPNYDFLKQTLDISDGKQLKEHILTVCEAFDFKELAQDVEVFLFEPNDVKRILHFIPYFKTVKL